jgi:hypothetical protein
MYWWSLDDWKVSTSVNRVYLTRPSYVNPTYEKYLFTAEEDETSWWAFLAVPTIPLSTTTMFYIELFENRTTKSLGKYGVLCYMNGVLDEWRIVKTTPSVDLIVSG